MPANTDEAKDLALTQKDKPLTPVHNKKFCCGPTLF